MPNLVPEKKRKKTNKKNLMLIISPSAHSTLYKSTWFREFKLLNTKTFRIQDV